MKSVGKYRKAFATRTDQVAKFPNEAFAQPDHLPRRGEQRRRGDRRRWRALVHASTSAELFKPLMAKNQLYSYEYLRTLMALEVDPNDIPDAQLKQHPMVVVGNPDEVIRKLEQLREGRRRSGHLLQAGRPHPASEDHELAEADGEACAAALQPEKCSRRQVSVTDMKLDEIDLASLDFFVDGDPSRRGKCCASKRRFIGTGTKTPALVNQPFR